MPRDTDKLDEIANDIDDVKVAVEELAEAPAAGVNADTVGSLKSALEQAIDAVDQLEDDAESTR